LGSGSPLSEKPKASVGQVDWLETAEDEYVYREKFLPRADPWEVIFFEKSA
jgi:hypothetical protein